MKIVILIIVVWMAMTLMPIFVVWGISSFATLSITPILEWQPMTRALSGIWVVGMTLSCIGFFVDIWHK